MSAPGPLTDPTGIPGWSAMASSRARWRMIALLSIAAAVGAVVFASGVIGDLADTLNRRTPAIVYLEELGEQQACVDGYEADHDIAVGQVVLAAILPEAVPGAPPPPSPADFADDVERAVVNLQRLDRDLDLRDPGNVLCQVPQPPPPLTDVEAARLAVLMGSIDP